MHIEFCKQRYMYFDVNEPCTKYILLVLICAPIGIAKKDRVNLQSSYSYTCVLHLSWSVLPVVALG